MQVMHYFKNFTEKNVKSLTSVILIGGLVLLLYWPALKLRFSLIDDGLMVLIAKRLLSDLLTFNLSDIVAVVFEPQFGRVRPAYWLIESLLTILGFYTSWIIHFYRILILLLTLYFVNKITLSLKVGYVWRIMTLIFFSFDWINFENYYRLGPVEPYLGLFFAITLFLIFFSKKKNYLYLLILILLGSFTKENYFICFVPLLAGYFLLSQNQTKTLEIKKKLLFSSILLFMFGIFVLLIRYGYGAPQGYASQYQVDYVSIISTFSSYQKQLFYYHTPFIQLSFLYFLYFVFKVVKNRKWKLSASEVFYIVLWVNVFLQLMILTPWKFALGRYLILATLSLSLIYALTITKLSAGILKFIVINFPELKDHQNVLKVALALLFLSFPIVRSIFPIANYQLFQKTDSHLTYNLLTALSLEIPTNETVLANYQKGDANIEIYLETPWHLALFYDRPDIKFEYLDESNLCASEDRYIFDRRSDRFVNSEIFEDSSKFSIIKSGEEAYKPINYGAVRDSFLYGTKTEGWSNSYLFDWKIVKQNKNTCIEKDNEKN